MSEIAERFAGVRERVAAASARSGRDPSDVTIVAVSKRQPDALVEAAAACGVTVFGEIHAQALARRCQAFPGARWDFIGAIQTNKAKLLVPGAGLIHSVGSLRAAQAIGRRARACEAPASVLIEVDTSPAGPRAGVGAEGAPDLAASVLGVDGVRLLGLMSMPPRGAEAEDARPHFALVRALRDRIRDDLGTPLPELSMGMSGDYEVAVEEGATLIRVGTAIFGPRPEAGVAGGTP